MKHFDLFSGYGGFSLALKNVYGNNISGEKQVSEQESLQSNGDLLHSTSERNWQDRNEHTTTIGFSEIDKYASSVLKYHWPNTKNYGDISKIDWSEVPDFDLLTGGSPCQDLSIAGKRNGLAGERSGLFYEYMRAVREKRPRYFIWENVKGALSSNKGFDFAAVLNEMAEAGYSLWWQVLNAKDFGVPQNRERIFVIGFRDGSPREVLFESRANGKNLSEITQGVSDAQRIYDTDGLAKSQKALGGGQGAKTGLYAITRGRSTEPWKESEIAPSRRLSDKDDIKIIDKKGNDKNKDYASTLTGGGHSGGNHSDMDLLQSDTRIRRLTPTECERLMGLPDDWTKWGYLTTYPDGEVDGQLISDSQRYKLCGNGVVVNVVEEIIKQLIL